MAQTVTTQMNEFRRLEDGRIVLDGLVWSQHAEKAIEITLIEESLKFDALYKTFVGKLKSVDVRHLEMPEPMTTILEELEQLLEGFALFVDHKKVPQFLLPELEERNFEIHYNKRSIDHLQLLMFKK